MSKNEDIRRYTGEQLEAMRARGESQTDWPAIPVDVREQVFELVGVLAAKPGEAEIGVRWVQLRMR